MGSENRTFVTFYLNPIMRERQEKGGDSR